VSITRDGAWQGHCIETCVLCKADCGSADRIDSRRRWDSTVLSVAFGLGKNVSSGRSQTYLFVRRAVKRAVVITDADHSYRARTELCSASFCQG
jgi:hypothetical protein